MTGSDVVHDPAAGRPAADLRIDVHAAGAVLWRRGGSSAAEEVEVALVHRPRYDDWSLPKGKLDRRESMPTAAVREVAEETGFDVRLGARLGEVHYGVLEGRKLVRYWAAQARGGRFAANAETDELRWLPPPAAAALLSYDRDRAVLDRFTGRPVPSSMLLVVRHAKAGSHSKWTGDDTLRPLSKAGRAQVGQLTALLRLFGPERVHTAPLSRCRQTIEPLARELGCDIVEEPLLGEDDYWVDPDAGLARLRELAAWPGVTVLCSQGGVIPAGVEALAAGSGLREAVFSDRDTVPSRKASTWALGHRDDTLLTADYYRTPTA